jgi:hypothetical protein
MLGGGASLAKKLELGAWSYLCETREFKVPETIQIDGDTKAISVYTTTL